MIAYSKGDLDKLLDINIVWSLIFMIMYYAMVIFTLHAAFHQMQTHSMKKVSLLNSLKENDILPDEPTGPRDPEQTRKETIGQLIRSL